MLFHAAYRFLFVARHYFAFSSPFLRFFADFFRFFFMLLIISMLLTPSRFDFAAMPDTPMLSPRFLMLRLLI